MINTIGIPPTPKASRRHFLGLFLLGVLLLILALLSQWLWLTNALKMPEVQILLPSERAPLISTLLKQKAIIWCFGISIVSLITAIIVAVSPLAWWLYVLAALGKTLGVRLTRTGAWGQAQQSAEEWVAAQAALLQLEGAQESQINQPSAEMTAPGQPTTDSALSHGQSQSAQAQPGEQSAVQQPGAQPGAQSAPAAQPGAPQPQAQPGAPQPGVQQAGAQPSQPQTAVQQPGVPQPQAQQGLQQLLTQGENVDLKELTDIGDILSSFKDNEDVSPYLLALSQSLDEIDVKALVARCRRMAERLATESPYIAG